MPEQVEDGDMVELVAVSSECHGVTSERTWVAADERDHRRVGSGEPGGALLPEAFPGRIGHHRRDRLGPPPFHVDPHGLACDAMRFVVVGGVGDRRPVRLDTDYPIEHCALGRCAVKRCAVERGAVEEAYAEEADAAVCVEQGSWFVRAGRVVQGSGHSVDQYFCAVWAALEERSGRDAKPAAVDLLVVGDIGTGIELIVADHDDIRR